VATISSEGVVVVLRPGSTNISATAIANGWEYPAVNPPTPNVTSNILVLTAS
jgi:hypothetical protein